jgi:hypothetical protein
VHATTWLLVKQSSAVSVSDCSGTAAHAHQYQHQAWPHYYEHVLVCQEQGEAQVQAETRSRHVALRYHKLRNNIVTAAAIQQQSLMTLMPRDVCVPAEPLDAPAGEACGWPDQRAHAEDIQ